MIEQLSRGPGEPAPAPFIHWEVELIDGTPGKPEKGSGRGIVNCQGTVIVFPIERGGHVGFNLTTVKRWVVHMGGLEVPGAIG